jgi:pimeloyl-ACP methyl ester carboxylesterase
MRSFLTFLLSLSAIGAGLYVLLCALLYSRQEASIFYPGPNDRMLVEQWSANRIEIPVSGATLEGWWTDNPGSATPAVILYFGGNAEDVLYTAGTARNLAARRLLVVNYRGYGGSTGQPGQKELYADALAIYDHAIREGTDPTHVVVMGRSLGSGVATMLAAHRPVAGAILITPFDSLASVAAGHYPIFPVRLLLRHPFPSDEWARQISRPALIVAARNDFVVPARHAQRLGEAWAGPKEIHILQGVGHNDVDSNADYYPLVNRFLSSIAQ